MKKAFIIVTVEGLEKFTENIVAEIKSLGFKDSSIYIVKNEKYKQGYAEGVNRGIKKALKDGVDYFFIANPDISLHSLKKDSLREVLKHFDICGFAMHQDGKVFYGGTIDKILLSGGLNEKKPTQRFQPCDFVSGSLMGFSKKVIDKIGFFDETFFMYYEDVDFCKRAKEHGFSIGIDSNVAYEHFETLKSNQRYIKSSYMKFFRQHASWYSWVRLLMYNVKRRPFIFNFLSLNASSFIIKLLNFLLFIFLIKYLNTRDYGVYNIVWAHIGLLMPLADFGTTNFGILHLKEQKLISFSDLFSFRIILAVIIAIVTLFLGYIFRLDAGLMVLILITLPVIIANAISGSLLIEVSSENRSYVASILSIIFNVILITTLIIMLTLHLNLVALFTAVGISYLLYSVVNLYLVRNYQKILPIHLPSQTQILQIINRSFIFVLLGFFAGLYFKADIFMLNYFKGAQVVGIYSAGYKFFEALMFVGASYTVSATPIFRKFLNEDRFAFLKKTKRDGALLLGGGILLAISSSLLAPLIFPFFLKNDFLQSIRVFQIVIFAFPFMLFSTVLMNVLYLLNKTRWVVKIFLAQIIFNIVLNYFFIPHYSYIASSYITVASEIINAFLVLFLFRKAYENFT